MISYECVSPDRIDSRAFRIELASSFLIWKEGWKGELCYIKEFRCMQEHLCFAQKPCIIGSCHLLVCCFSHHLNASFNTFLPHSPIKKLLGNKMEIIQLQHGGHKGNIMTCLDKQETSSSLRSDLNWQECWICGKVAPFVKAFLNFFRLHHFGPNLHHSQCMTS